MLIVVGTSVAWMPRTLRFFNARDIESIFISFDPAETSLPTGMVRMDYVGAIHHLLSYLTEDNVPKFRERLEYLLEKWPDTDMTPMAGSIVKGLRQGRQPNKGMSNQRGMLWTMRLSNDSVGTNPDGTPANFERDPNSPQYLVLAFPKDSVNANQLLYDVARFNFSSFVVRDFDLEQMSFGNVGLLIIKGFGNVKQLEHYRNVMAEKHFELPDGVRPIMISKPNFELLLREGRSFEEYFRYEEEKTVADTEDAALKAPVADEEGEESLME